MPLVGEYFRGDSPTQIFIPRLTPDGSTPIAVPEARRGDPPMPHTPQVYLDGVLVAVETISPEKHKFIGVWRSPAAPVPTTEHPYDVYDCPCLQSLWDVGSVVLHWQQGHMDVPQYQSLSPQEGVAHAHQEES